MVSRPGTKKRWWQAWDLKENLKSLWARDSRAIPQLDGFRLAACLWVIAYHSNGIVRGAVIQEYPLFERVLQYDLFKKYLWDTWLYKVILSGDMGVDVFFVLSGLLIAYILMSEVDCYDRSQKDGAKPDLSTCNEKFKHACGGIRYWRFLFRRWLRLMPAFLLSIPTTATSESTWKVCQDWWWPNLLLVNNFVGPGTFLMGCLGQSWSIAMEFQFYIVSPMFCVWATRSLFHDARQRKYRGWIVFAALLLISILVRTLMLMIADPNFEATIAIPPEYPHIAAAQPASFTLFYSKTYARFGPYIVGMLVAYLYRYNLKSAQSRLEALHPSPAAREVPYGCRYCWDGRRKFGGYLRFREKTCRPRLCCRSGDAVEEGAASHGVQVVSLAHNPNHATIQEPLLASTIPAEEEEDAALPGHPQPDVPSTASVLFWAVIGLAILGVAVLICVLWPDASPLTSFPFLSLPPLVEPSSNIHVRRFIFITFRTFFAGTTAALVLLCLIKRGTWIDWLLSWQVFVPFARLTYSAYLLQFLPMSLKSVDIIPSTFHATAHWGAEAAFMFTYVLYFALISAVTFAMSFVMYMVVEKPAMNLRAT